MNFIFRTVWNRTLGRLVVASEAARSRVKGSGGRQQPAPVVTTGSPLLSPQRPLALAIGLLGMSITATTATAQDATYENLTVTQEAILSALLVNEAATFNGAATFTDSLTVGGVDVATATDIDGLDTRVGANETAITGLGSDIDGLDTRVGDNETAITGLGSDIDGLDTRVGDNETAINDLGTSITTEDLNVGSGALVASSTGVTVGTDLDMDGNKITNLAPGSVVENSADAVTGGQLYSFFGMEEDIEGIRYFRVKSELPDSAPEGENSIAIGPEAATTNGAVGSIAMGQNAVVGTEDAAAPDGEGSIAIGRNSQASGNSTMALGDGAKVESEFVSNALALGAGASVSEYESDNAAAIGNSAAASAKNATALGNSASASGTNATALGSSSQASGTSAIALGQGAVAAAEKNISIGDLAGVGTDGVTANDQVNNIAIGDRAGQNVAGQRNVAMGKQAGNNVIGNDNIAFGDGASSSLEGDENISVGKNANQSIDNAERAIGIGSGVGASTDGVAIGTSAKAGENGLALGRGATTGGAGVALGHNALAASGFVALGSGSRADGADLDGAGAGRFTSQTAPSNAVSVGSSEPGSQSLRRIVNVADGARDSDAATVRQLQRAVDDVALGATVNYEELAAEMEADWLAEIDNNKPKYAHVNDGGIGKENEGNTGATGTDSIAIGPVASTSSSADNSTAIGHKTEAEGASSVVLGHDIKGWGDNSTTIGNSRTEAYGESGVAIGTRAQSRGDNSIVIGTRSESDDQDGTNVQNSIVIGTDSKSTAQEGIVIGRDSLVNAERGIAQGDNAEATAVDAMAYGTESRASGVRSQASGTKANASGTDSIATGTGATGMATDGIAMGTGAVAGFTPPVGESIRNHGSIAIGDTSKAIEQNALALGVSAQAQAESSTAIGDSAVATEDAEDGLAVGSSANVTAQNASAFGQSAEALGIDALAVGSGARATEQSASAVGRGAQATAQDASAFGQGASASEIGALATGSEAEAIAQNATALGQGARALHEGSVALGAGSETDSHNSGNYTFGTYGVAGSTSSDTKTVSVGTVGNERQIQFVAPGVVSVDSTDAINGSQLHTTNEALRTFGNSTVDVMGGNAAFDSSTGELSFTNIGGGNVPSGSDGTINNAITYAAQGWEVSADGDTVTRVAPGDAVDFGNDDGNIDISRSASPEGLTFNLAENINLGDTGSVTTGDTVMNTDGVTVGDPTGNDPSTIVGAGEITVAGSDTNPNTITIDGDTGTIGGLTNRDFDPDNIVNGQAATEDQLGQVRDAVNAGWNVSVDDEGVLADGSNNVGPEGVVDFSSDANIDIARDGTDLAFALNETIDLGDTGSVTTGDTAMNTDGVTVGDPTGNDPSTIVGAGEITVAGSDTNPNTITIDGDTGTIGGLENQTIDYADFADGSGRAASEEQLSEVDGALGDLADTPITFGGDSGETERLLGERLDIVTTNDNLSTEVTDDETLAIALNENVDLGESGSVTTGDTVMNTDGVSIGDDVQLSGTGLAVGDTSDPLVASTEVEAGTITLVADPTTGPASTISIDANSGTIEGLTNQTIDYPEFADNSGRAATEEQLSVINETANLGWNVSTNGEDAENVGPGDTVDFSNEDGNIVIEHEGTNLLFNLADAITADSLTAGDTVIDTTGVGVGDDVHLGDTGLVIADGPSITVNGIDAGGQAITNVAPGLVSENSTDAINGSQLWDVEQVANAGWNLTTNGDADSQSNVTPYDTVDFSGDGNVLVSNEGNEVSVALADTITLGEDDSAVTVNGEDGFVSVGDTMMNGDGIQVGNNVHLDDTGLVIAGGPSVTVSGINAGGMQITGVGSGLGGQALHQISGDELMNAVNVGDLQGVASDIGENVAAAKTEVVEGGNISVTQSTGENGQDIYTVETQRDVDFDSIEVGSVNIDQSNVDDDGNTIIAGVGRGEVSESSTDAVNGSQLHDVAQQVGDIGSELDGGMNFGADEGEEVNRKLGDTVAVRGDDNITTSTISNDDGVGIEVALNRELDVDSVTAGGTVVSDHGVTIEDGPSMTVDGIDGGGQRITNVAPGVDATDAANVGQMQELNQRFANEINNVHGRISEVGKNANAGTASALAAGTVPQAWMPGKSMVGVGAGNYEGESAVSVGISRMSDNGRWIIQGKVTGDSQSNFGAGVGAGWHW